MAGLLKGALGYPDKAIDALWYLTSIYSKPLTLAHLILNGWCRPVEKRERSLQHSGPTWKAPMLQDVLYNLPFLRHSPRSMIEVGYLHALAAEANAHCVAMQKLPQA